MSKITIERVKNIERLEFELPNSKGVYLLAGSNGVGKTSLMVCLYRLGYSSAFADNFKSPNQVSYIDTFNDTQITYSTSKGSVYFSKVNQNWASKPQNMKKIIFDDFGFSQVIFIKADGARLQATTKELEERPPRKADANIIDGMNQIFETDKYNELKSIKIGQGRAREIYLIKVGRQGFYSEKQFSLGELLVLKIVRLILKAQAGALVLIDEIEMALHPRVQRRLINYLEEIAIQKNLKVIISTHSATMIKSVSKERLILLEQDIKNKSIIHTITPCYPSRALQNVDFEASIPPDYIFLVEDENAQIVLEEMISRVYKESTITKARWSIVPIGGYREVVNFLKRVDKTLFRDISVTAFLDKDVEDEQQEYLSGLGDERQAVRFLPCTPEVGIINLLMDNIFQMNTEFKDFSTYTVDISQIIEEEGYTRLNKQSVRDLAKDQLEYIVQSISTVLGKNKSDVRRMLYSFYVSKLSIGELKSRLLPVIK